MSPHPSYLALNRDPNCRLAPYRTLFRETPDPDAEAALVHTGSNKASGHDRFREQIGALVGRAWTSDPGRPPSAPGK